MLSTAYDDANNDMAQHIPWYILEVNSSIILCSVPFIFLKNLCEMCGFPITNWRILVLMNDWYSIVSDRANHSPSSINNLGEMLSSPGAFLGSIFE